MNKANKIDARVGDVNIYIYIQWFWLQIVLVSPGTHLVKNIESQSRNIESQIKKKIYKSVIENAWAFV